MYRTPPNKIIYVDPGLCLGCHSCEMACAVAHSEAGNIFEALAMEGLVSRTHVVAVDASSVPMQCRQCEDAPCTKVCPTGAMRQAEGLGTVSLDEQSCIGCKLCSMICPFGVITVVNRPVEGGSTNGGVATKCDLCIQWREKNGKTQTACEEACQTKAIHLVDLYEYRQALTRARAAEIAAAHRSLGMGL
ncbi:MAG: 4Fe-4S dicluster domain-containing protein [Candidatus Thiodiazotropha sp.]